MHISAGASGAVFGVFGALMGFLVLRRDCLPPGMLRDLLKSGAKFLLYNLAFSLSVRGVDMAAHLGGLIAGIACGLTLSQPVARMTPARRGVRNGVLAVLAGAGLSVLLPHLPPAPADVETAIERAVKVDLTMQAQLRMAFEQRNQHQMADSRLARIINEHVLPTYRESRTELEQLERVPVEEQPRVAALTAYLNAQEDSLGHLARGLRYSNPAAVQRFEETNRAAADLLQRYNALTAAR
jgi:rhomboid protease GluP